MVGLIILGIILILAIPAILHDLQVKGKLTRFPNLVPASIIIVGVVLIGGLIASQVW